METYWNIKTCFEIKNDLENIETLIKEYKRIINRHENRRNEKVTENDFNKNIKLEYLEKNV